MAGAVIRPTMTRVAQAAVPGGVHARAGDGAASKNVMSRPKAEESLPPPANSPTQIETPHCTQWLQVFLAAVRLGMTPVGSSQYPRCTSTTFNNGSPAT
jgi:hypothetical protein